MYKLLQNPEIKNIGEKIKLYTYLTKSKCELLKE